jgi:thiol-disulfide isomerase/thioredoxin
MKTNLLAVAILALGIWTYRYKVMNYFRPMQVSSTFIQSTECRQKKFCAIVYVAPWCPACKQYALFLKQGLTKLKRPGEVALVVIMGMENQNGENEREAKIISDKVIIDKTSDLARDLRIEHFPTFMVVDGDQKVMLRDREAFEWLSQEI